MFIYYPESIEPLGRQVYAAVGTERGSGGKKQVLRFHKGAVLRRDVVGEFSHLFILMFEDRIWHDDLGMMNDDLGMMIKDWGVSEVPSGCA
jgi:hypothetical protein